jgi:hypothetical protein
MIGPVGTTEELVGKERTLFVFYMAAWKALGDGSIDELVERLNNLVAMSEVLQELLGPVTTVDELRGVVQKYIDAAEELKLFARPCPGCGKRTQATSDHDWRLLVEANVLADWPCRECRGKEVQEDIMKCARASAAEKPDRESRWWLPAASRTSLSHPG